MGFELLLSEQWFPSCGMIIDEFFSRIKISLLSLWYHFILIILLTDLHSVGGLHPLLGYLKNSHANIRAKAAEVVTTIVQNNPRSQQLVMELNGLESLLLNFTSDPDVTARTKALGAISCKYIDSSDLFLFRLGGFRICC